LLSRQQFSRLAFLLSCTIIVASIHLESGQMAGAQPINGSGVPEIQDDVREVKDRLDVISHLLEESKQGRVVQLYVTVIAFLMGLAFVIFGLYIGQEHKLALFTKRLYLLAFFSLIVPVTVILMRYIVVTLLSGTVDAPELVIAFLFLIPVASSYTLMIVKYKRKEVADSRGSS
ncbi:MAG TPA: hypothetical protein VE130_10435, partial [Nitrososphaeraceae archaeon]|nr:hypothetical protein [Nitrososphaeraceae archaeon]